MTRKARHSTMHGRPGRAARLRPAAAHAVALAAAACAALANAPVANAGQFELHSCRLPNGAAVGLVGYLPNGGNDLSFERTDGCGTGAGYFDATMRAGATHASGATRWWMLDLTGTGLTLRRMRADVAVRTRPRQSGWVTSIADLIASNGQGNFSTGGGGGRGSLARWDDPGNVIDTGTISPTDGYLFGVRCESDSQWTCDPVTGSEPKSYVRVYRAQATLEDLADPEVASFGGPLASAPGPHRGLEGFALRARDRGAGVYRLIVELDGGTIARQVIDANSGQCTDQYEANFSAYDFSNPVPCKLDVNGSFEFDTRRLPDGAHTATFSIEDAAGNGRVALGPVRDWVVDNVPPPSIEDAPHVTPYDPRVGETVTCDPGRWNFHGARRLGDFAYRWQSSSDGLDWRQILGETGATYAVREQDVGRALRCEVTTRSSEGTTTVTSTETRPVRPRRVAATLPPAPFPSTPLSPADRPSGDRLSAAELHLGCGRRTLSLISATARGHRVRLTGVVAAAHRDSRVAILESGRHVATTVPRADGFFHALVSRPARRRYGKVRYQAGVAGVRSVSLKLPQDLATRSITLLAGDRTVELAGRVKRRGYRPVTVKRILCGRYETVARGLTDRRGRYRVRFAAPGARAGLYRVETRVARGKGARRGRLVRSYARAKAITFAERGSG